ncbi:MAG TPA: squalene synthase HpnC [Acidimicrobiales bacterium]|nr:squalene synthase HpnC [Acidimicrobiales bacterium]
MGEPARTPAGVPTEAEVLGRAAGENFPVASRWLLGSHRDHLLALYGFARLVDELGDRAPGDRLALLDWAESELERAAAGSPDHAVFARLAPTIRTCRLPLQPFRDLIEANRRDQSVGRYATFDDLRGYCRLSADPVGRLVLAVFGVEGGEETRLSDAVCTGLQLVEHWQDVVEDAAAGRIYLPLEDMEAFGVTEADVLAAGTGSAGAGAPGGPASARLRALIEFETARARQLLETGAGLVGRLSGRPRLAVAGFVAGGLATADALAGRGYDVLAGPPRPRRPRMARHALALLARRRGRP